MLFSDLQNVRCFVVNMDRSADRLEITLNRIKEAGFTNVERFKAVDASVDSLEDNWALHGNPKKNITDREFFEYKGKQGCMLSHLNLYKKIIQNQIPLTIVFEDDVQFHKNWETLAPIYWNATPKDWDILYMGSQIDFIMEGHILMTPVFCTHAYIITLDGAKKIYDFLINNENGVSTIDCMLIDHMKDVVFRNKKPIFKWYAWNATMFVDTDAIMDKGWTKRNTGLVFQDESFGSFVRPW